MPPFLEVLEALIPYPKTINGPKMSNLTNVTLRKPYPLKERKGISIKMIYQLYMKLTSEDSSPPPDFFSGLKEPRRPPGLGGLSS